MANLPCPKCGSIKWWWRDETGCNHCNQEPPKGNVHGYPKTSANKHYIIDGK